MCTRKEPQLCPKPVKEESHPNENFFTGCSPARENQCVSVNLQIIFKERFSSILDKLPQRTQPKVSKSHASSMDSWSPNINSEQYVHTQRICPKPIQGVNHLDDMKYAEVPAINNHQQKYTSAIPLRGYAVWLWSSLIYSQGNAPSIT